MTSVSILNRVKAFFARPAVQSVLRHALTAGVAAGMAGYAAGHGHLSYALAGAVFGAMARVVLLGAESYLLGGSGAKQ